MKVIIPAKRHSSRVPDKNWKNFYQGKNLVEIKIEQVLKAVPPTQIYLSCDSPEKESLADKYGIHFILRHTDLASDNTTWPDAFSGMVAETPAAEEEDIAWVEVINPLFDRYSEMFSTWEKVKSSHDSMVLAAVFNKFLVTQSGKPVNFMFGKWHAMSQNLEKLYSWDSACIMKKKDMLYFSYPIGRSPYIFDTGDECVDIDTPKDFRLAQLLYQMKQEE